jgi:hypothetical protein
MTRAEKRAEEKARMARVAVRVFAEMAAKRAVIAQIRADGLRVHDFANRTLSMMATEWLEAHPELYAQARQRAVELGYC